MFYMLYFLGGGLSFAPCGVHPVIYTDSYVVEFSPERPLVLYWGRST
jgi:hypothetical protein